jgi:hypothetical protein
VVKELHDFETWWEKEGRYIRGGEAKGLAELAYKTGYADAVQDGAAAQSDAKPADYTRGQGLDFTKDREFFAQPDAERPPFMRFRDAEQLITQFANRILHGDDEHKAWLLEAASAFVHGRPLPAPRGKGTHPEARNEAPSALEQRVAALEITCGFLMREYDRRDNG